MSKARDLANFQSALDARPVPGSPGIAFRMAAGATGASQSSGTVTFPANRFSVSPSVLISIQNPATSSYIGNSSISSTSFTWASVGNVTGLMTWLAIQITSTSRDG